VVTPTGPHRGEAAGDAPVGEPRAWPPDERRGEGILRFDLWATVAFAVVSAAAAAVPDPLVWVSVPLDLALFAIGCGAFLWAYAVAIGRSRYEVLTMGGVFFLGAPTAPARVTRTFRLLLLVQVVVSVTAAAVRPFTPLAFSVLAPMLGLGLMALWGARYGTFVSRSDGGDAA
jgi:hypothetical protein